MEIDQNKIKKILPHLSLNFLEKYCKIIEGIGFETIKDAVPFPVKQLENAFVVGDVFFSTTNQREWDAKFQTTEILIKNLKEVGLNGDVWTEGQNSSLLKFVALLMVLENMGETSWMKK